VSTTGSAVPGSATFVGGTDGTNLRAIAVDASGNQKVVNAGTSNTSAASWTSATALNTAVTLLNATQSFDTLILTINQGSTITAGAVTFEISNDNANWVTRTGVDVSNFGGDISTYTLVASTYKMLKFNVGGFQYFRVRLSTAITGTATVTIGYAASNNGYPLTQVQELKDSGRTPVVLFADSLTGITTEALATLSINKGGVTSSATSYTVTAGKTLRIQCFTLSVVGSTTTAVTSRARVRAAATVSATSPVFIAATAGTPAAAANVSGHYSVPITDGLEVAGGQQVGISHIESSAVGGSTSTGTGVSFYLVGYEY
jgi:hypothetical protein